MKNDELYDEEENDKEDKPKMPKRKLKVIPVLVIVLAAVSICGSAYYAWTNHLMLSDYKEMKETTTLAKQTIEQQKKEIEDLKLQVETYKAKEEAEKTSKINKTNQATSVTVMDIGDDDIYFEITNDHGLNIYEEANADTEEIASLAKGEQFERVGDVIENEDGSLWVRIAYEHGYGCIRKADGTYSVKKIEKLG